MLIGYLNPQLRYYFFRLLKTNFRHIEILLLASSPSSACDSAPACQILYELDDQRQSYNVISIFQDGGHSDAIYLGFRVWLCLTFLKVQVICIPNFDQICQSTAEVLLLPVPENKRLPYWNSNSGFYLTFLLLFSCDSALAYQTLCKFDDRRRIYDISILQYGGHAVANLLPDSGLAMSHI